MRDYDYSQAGVYFVTICTKDKACLFGDVVKGEMVLNDAGRIVQAVWDALPTRFPGSDLDSFIIMPNHVHAIIAITDVGAIHELPLPHNNPIDRRRMLIPKIVGYAKMNTAKRINQLRATPGTRIWQRNYYEHVIRNEGDINDVREYVVQNPMKWELDEENPQSI